jgi:hypothetical protein
MAMWRMRVGGWAAVSVGLVLGAMALVAAQAPRNKGPVTEAPRVSAPTPRLPQGATFPGGLQSFPGVALSPGTSIPMSPLPQIPPQGSFAPQAALLAVRLELRTGLALEGQIEAAALPGVTRFGEVAIPLSTIRGVRLHDGSVESKPPDGPSATVILDNDDSLTMALRVQQLHVKTEWGTAIIDLPQVRSLLLTSEPMEWEEAGGRWRLKRLEPPPAAAEAVDDAASVVPAETPPPAKDEPRARVPSGSAS